jgi:hypothetical protein
MHSLAKKVNQALRLSDGLAADFMIVFARFEYALKRAGYYRSDGNTLQPDWDAFAKRLATSTHADLLKAGETILKNPPSKEAVTNGSWTWADIRVTNAANDLERLLLYVRRIRNNLFHGGKFPPDQPKEYARDKQLLESSLAVLEATLDVPEATGVRQFFFDAYTEQR